MKNIGLYLSVAILSMLLGFAYRFHLPQIKTWILSSIQIYSYEHLPVVIKPTDVDFNLIPLSLSIKDVKVTNNKNKLPALKKLLIKEINVYPDLISLGLGKAKVSEVNIHDTKLVMIFPKKMESSKSTSKNAWENLPTQKEVQDLLKKIPVGKISLTRFNYFARYEEFGLSNLVVNSNLNLSKYGTNLFLDFELPNFKIKETENDKSLLDFSIENKLAITPKKLQLEYFRIFQKDSYIDLKAMAENWTQKSEHSFQAQINTKIDLNQVRNLAKRFKPDLKMIPASGVLESRFNIDSKDLKQIDGEIALEEFILDGFKIGFLKTKLNASKDSLNLKDFEIKRQKNHLFIPELKALIKENDISFDSTVRVGSLELRQLLNDIKVGDTPLRLDLKSDPLACSGKIKPKLEILCEGKIYAPFFRVFNSKTNFTIHSFKNAEVSGKVKIDDKGVYPDGKIQLGDSEGSASGIILYEEGFDIRYQSENFDFKNIEGLAQLPITGTTKLKGNTKGNSKYATIDMDIDGKNFSLFSYKLGDIRTAFNYSAGILSFKKLKSKIGRSQLNASIQVNLLKNSIQGNVSSNKADLENIQDMISHHLKLPAKLRGDGKLTLNFEGPLAFNKLNYDLSFKAPLFKVGYENFEDLNLLIRSRKGFVKTREATAKKQEASLVADLSLNPDYDLNIKLISKDLRLEYVNFTENLGGQMTAALQMGAQVEGRIPNLNYDVTAEVKQLDLGGTNLRDSKIHYTSVNKGHKVEAELFGKSLILNSEIPSSGADPFYLNMDATDFNFTALFSLLGINTNQIGFRSQVSASADLKSSRGGIWNSTGFVKIEDLKLQRGPLSLQSTGPLEIQAKNGIFQSKKWTLKGDGTDLNYQVLPTQGGKLNSSLEGSINLALASFTIPFVDNLRGELSLSTKVSGSIDKPKVSGSAVLKNSQFSIPSFPHPFERINSDIIFNNNNVVMNKIEAELAGGKLLANGNIKFEGLTNIPTKITGSIKGSRLEFIEGVQMLSDGDFSLTGSWFPFKITANAVVTEGKISPKTNINTSQKVRPSRYLPKILLKNTFDPITLDVKARLTEKVLIQVPEVKSYIRGDIKLSGPAGAAIYSGDIAFVPGGTLFFRDTPFNIATGYIRFNDIRELNPDVFIDAQTSIIEQSSQTNYDVNLILNGTIKNFTTEINSQPELAESDLISLLALGLTSSQLDQQSVENQRDLQMMELGAAVISNSPLGKEIEERTGFTFKLSTDIDETDTTELKVVISKQVTPNIGASASILGNNSKKDVKIEYKLNTDLSLIGSWESTTFEEDGGSSTDNGQQSDILGLDLRYKVEFE